MAVCWGRWKPVHGGTRCGTVRCGAIPTRHNTSKPHAATRIYRSGDHLKLRRTTTHTSCPMPHNRDVWSICASKMTPCDDTLPILFWWYFTQLPNPLVPFVLVSILYNCVGLSRYLLAHGTPIKQSRGQSAGVPLPVIYI